MGTNKMRNLLSFHKRRKQKKERSYYFHKNGALLMKDLFATFGHRYNLPIRSFSLQELIRATNNFSEKVCGDEYGAFYRGSLERRPLLVIYSPSHNEWTIPHVIGDIVVTSQMSHHKNVLPLIGCCLELPLPAMVYDNALDHQFVEETFNQSNNGNNGKVISWRNRIRIAKDVSSVLIYLHRAFPTPIIFRDQSLQRVVMDRHGVAKLVGFGFSISLPPGELKVEDQVKGTWGYVDPEYYASSFVTEKTDVYGMGALMLALFAGQPSALTQCVECGRERASRDDDEDAGHYYGFDGNRISVSGIPIRDCRHFIQDNRRFKRFLDPKIFEEEGQNEDQVLEHLLALSNLALRCTEYRGEERPEMIDLAKQLSQMDKFVRNS